jgi:hypothetical protein
MLPADVTAALELQEIAYNWSEESPLTPERARVLESLVVRAVQLAFSLQTVWPFCTQEGSVWETGYYNSRIRTVEFLAYIVADILDRTRELLERTRAKHPEWKAPREAGGVAPGLEAARRVFTEARKLVEWLNRPRPPVNEDRIRHSQESLNRGEGEALSDIIARVEKGDPLVKD